jgi:hypothetical protein
VSSKILLQPRISLGHLLLCHVLAFHDLVLKTQEVVEKLELLFLRKSSKLLLGGGNRELVIVHFF